MLKEVLHTLTLLYLNTPEAATLKRLHPSTLAVFLQIYALGKYKRTNASSVQDIIRSFQPEELKFKNQKIHSSRMDNFLFSFKNNMKEPPKLKRTTRNRRLRYSGEHSCLPTSWPGFGSRPTHSLFSARILNRETKDLAGLIFGHFKGNLYWHWLFPVA